MTLGSGSNRALLAFLNIGNTATIPGSLTCVWDAVGANQSMTNIVSISGTNSSTALIVFSLINPVAGNKTITASWTGSVEAHLAGVSFTGVDQTGGATSFPHTQTANVASGTSGTITVTSATGNMVAAAFSQTANFFASTSGTTISLDTTSSGNSSQGSLYDNGAASVVCTSAWGGSVTAYAGIAVDILAAAGGAAVPLLGKPEGTIFIPGKHFGPTRGLRPTQAFPLAPSTTVPIGTSMIWM